MSQTSMDKLCAKFHLLPESQVKKDLLKFREQKHLKSPAYVPFSSPAWRGVFNFPTVLAQEQHDDALPTTLDKLQAKRPQTAVSDQDVISFLQKETGWDRLRALVSKDIHNSYHADLMSIAAACQGCTALGFLTGAITGGQAGREKFKEKNVHKKFDTVMSAKRKMNDAALIGSLRGGVLLGARVFIFTGIFMSTMQVVTTYRNRSSVFEYIAGGAVTGSLLKANLGLRGMASGLVIGGTIGLLGGIVIYGMLYATNQTQDKRHWQEVYHHLLRARQLENLGKSHLAKQEDSEVIQAATS